MDNHPGSPLLSIITVTYRDPVGLRKTLESLAPLGNSTLAWEHVIVDSSPDENAETLRRFAAPSRTLVEQPARGIYAAMNEGFARSRGEILWFLNSGDTLADAENLASAARELLADERAAMLLATAKITRDGVWQYDQAPRTGPGPLWGINRVCHQAVLFRRRAIAQIGAFSEEFKLVSDYDFHLRALAENLITRPFPGAIVYYDRGGQSAVQINKVFAEFRSVHRKLAREGKLARPFLHGVVWWAEKCRVKGIKALRALPGGAALGAAWNSFRSGGR